MTTTRPITIALDRRLLEHPQALHLRRMRAGIWLYLDLLARLPAGAGSIEVEPAAIGRDMGLPEGTVRSSLGHLMEGWVSRGPAPQRRRARDHSGRAGAGGRSRCHAQPRLRLRPPAGSLIVVRNGQEKTGMDSE